MNHDTFDLFTARSLLDLVTGTQAVHSTLSPPEGLST
jgi:hypothetical protein